jgi:hypothetical protein
MGREPVRQTNVTIHFKSSDLSVSQGTPQELGLQSEISGGQFAITASHIRLTVWIIGQVDQAKRRIVVQCVKDWLWSLKHPVLPMRQVMPMPAPATAPNISPAAIPAVEAMSLQKGPTP